MPCLLRKSWAPSLRALSHSTSPFLAFRPCSSPATCWGQCSSSKTSTRTSASIGVLAKPSRRLVGNPCPLLLFACIERWGSYREPLFPGDRTSVLSSLVPTVCVPGGRDSVWASMRAGTWSSADVRAGSSKREASGVCGR